MYFYTKAHLLEAFDAGFLSGAQWLMTEFALNEFEGTLSIAEEVWHAVVYGTEELQRFFVYWRVSPEQSAELIVFCSDRRVQALLSAQVDVSSPPGAPALELQALAYLAFAQAYSFRIFTVHGHIHMRDGNGIIITQSSLSFDDKCFDMLSV